MTLFTEFTERVGVAAENLARVLPVLAERGIAHVEISFSGEGDEGSVDGVSFSPKIEGFDPKAVNTDFARTENVLGDDGWKNDTRIVSSTVFDAMCDIGHEYAMASDVNWYDNEGGFGTLSIDVAAKSAHLEVNVNVRDAVTAFDRSFGVGMEPRRTSRARRAQGRSR